MAASTITPDDFMARQNLASRSITPDDFMRKFQHPDFAQNPPSGVTGPSKKGAPLPGNPDRVPNISMGNDQIVDPVRQAAHSTPYGDLSLSSSMPGAVGKVFKADPGTPEPGPGDEARMGALAAATAAAPLTGGLSWPAAAALEGTAGAAGAAGTQKLAEGHADPWEAAKAAATYGGTSILARGIGAVAGSMVRNGPKATLTAPFRLASRVGEAAANQKIAPIRPILSIMTPADQAAETTIRMPGRDIGLPKPRTPMEVLSPSTDQLPGRPYMPRPRAVSPRAPIPQRQGLTLPPAPHSAPTGYTPAIPQAEPDIDALVRGAKIDNPIDTEIGAIKARQGGTKIQAQDNTSQRILNNKALKADLEPKGRPPVSEYAPAIAPQASPNAPVSEYPPARPSVFAEPIAKPSAKLTPRQRLMEDKIAQDEARARTDVEDRARFAAINRERFPAQPGKLELNGVIPKPVKLTKTVLPEAAPVAAPKKLTKPELSNEDIAKAMREGKYKWKTR